MSKRKADEKNKNNSSIAPSLLAKENPSKPLSTGWISEDSEEEAEIENELESEVEQKPKRKKMSSLDEKKCASPAQTIKQSKKDKNNSKGKKRQVKNILSRSFSAPLNLLLPKDEQRKQGNKFLKDWIDSYDEKKPLSLIKMRPKPWQLERVKQWLQIREKNPEAHVVCEFATGSGKTFIFTILARLTQEKTLIVVPTLALYEQTLNQIVKYANLSVRGVKSKEIKAADQHLTEDGKAESLIGKYHCLVTTYQTLSKYYSKINFKFIPAIVLDEAHRAFSPPRINMVQYMVNQGCSIYAYTATPINEVRRKKEGVSSCYQLLRLPSPEKNDSESKTITPFNFMDAIKNGTNVPVITAIIRIKNHAKMTLESKENEDIDDKKAEDKIEAISDDIYPAIVDVYLNDQDKISKVWHRGKQCICFCPGIKSAENLAQEFNKHTSVLRAAYVDQLLKKKISTKKYYLDENARQKLKKEAEKEAENFCVAKAVHGGSKKSGILKPNNTAILKQYKLGEILVLTGADILIEGFDNPRTSIIINVRPTKSNVIKIQSCGRGFRIDPENENKKICYIYDLHWAKTDCLYFFKYLKRNDQFDFQIGEKIDEIRQLIKQSLQEEQKEYKEISVRNKKLSDIHRSADEVPDLMKLMQTAVPQSSNRNNYLEDKQTSQRQLWLGLTPDFQKEADSAAISLLQEVIELDQIMATIDGSIKPLSRLFNKNISKKINADKKPQSVLGRSEIKIFKSKQTDLKSTLLKVESTLGSLEIFFKETISFKNIDDQSSKKNKYQNFLTEIKFSVERKIPDLLNKYSDIKSQLHALLAIGKNLIDGENKPSREQEINRLVKEMAQLKETIASIKNTIYSYQQKFINAINFQREMKNFESLRQWKNKYKINILLFIERLNSAEELKKINIDINDIVLIKELIFFLSDNEGIFEDPPIALHSFILKSCDHRYKIEYLEEMLRAIPEEEFIDDMRDAKGRNPLHLILEINFNLDIFSLLYPRIKNKNMSSYLPIAAQYEPNCEWPIKQMLLLVLGANPFLKNSHNQLPEDLTKNISLYRLGNKRLFEHKATIDVTDAGSRNIIHYLMKQPSCRLFSLLLKKYPRLPISEADSAQKTPFYFLFSDIEKITPEHVRMAELLLDHQAHLIEYGSLDNKKNCLWHHAFQKKIKLLLPMTVRLLNKYFNEQIDQLNEEGLMPVNYLLEKFNYRTLFNENSNNFWTPTEIISVFEIIMKRNNSEIFMAIIDKLTLSLYQDILKMVKVFLTKQLEEEVFKVRDLINCFYALEKFSYKDDKIIEIINEISLYIANLEQAIEKLESKKEAVSRVSFNVKNREQSSGSVYDPIVILPSCLMEEEKDLSPMSRFSVSLPASSLPSVPSNHLMAAVTFIEVDIDVKDPDFDYQKIPLTKLELKQPRKPPNLDVKEDQKISSRDKEKSEPSVQLAKKARYKIGMWGEQCVYEKLKSHYYTKYNGEKCKNSLQEKDKGFTLTGQDSRGLSVNMEFIWNNKWPKECKNPDERWQKYESRKPYDMWVKKTQACEIYLLNKFPELSYSKAMAYRSCYLFSKADIHQMIYINQKGSVKSIKISDVVKYSQLVANSDLDEKFTLRYQLEPQTLLQYFSFIPNQITDALAAANGSIVKERIIEVKSTRSDTPHATFIPESEVVIMKHYRERYSIYRVFGATKSAENVRIEKIKDPFKKIANQECDFGVSLKI